MEKVILDGIPYSQLLEDLGKMTSNGGTHNQALLREVRAIVKEELKGALKSVSFLNDKLFSRHEAAKLLNISYRRVRYLLEKGILSEDIATGKIPGRCINDLLTQ